MEVNVYDLEKVHGDAFTMTPEGEVATLICEGGRIPSDVAQLLPQYTKIVELPSPNDKRYYRVTVRGRFTIEQFVQIVEAFAIGEFGNAYDMIDRLTPQMDRPL